MSILNALTSLARPARKTARSPRSRKLGVHRLENRQMLAVAVTYVNDNWDLAPAGDLDDSGAVSAGDIVNNSTDAGGTPTVTAVFGTNAFANINDAIAETSANGRVNVLEGEYTEDVTVNQSLTIAGANAGISAGVEAGTRGDESVLHGGIHINADNVTIDGLTILGGTEMPGDTARVSLAAGASGATIVNNILTGEDAGRGILSSFNGDNDDLLIQDNEISHWLTGVFNQSNDGVEITGNLIHDNTAGVANDFANDVRIELNDFNDNQEAVGTFESTNLVVIDNDLADNVVAIANYGGEEVDATANFWGTTDPDEIDDLIQGAVLAASPLAESPFDVVEEVNEIVFSDADGATLTVNTLTGAFEFDNGDGLISTGTGARIQNGKLKIHTHDDAGHKIDVKGDVDGSIDVAIKQLGKGVKKQGFSLTANA